MLTKEEHIKTPQFAHAMGHDPILKQKEIICQTCQTQKCKHYMILLKWRFLVKPIETKGRVIVWRAWEEGEQEDISSKVKVSVTG